MNIRTDIPQLNDREVRLINLKAIKFNGKCGKVVGWNNNRERFLVKLHDDGVTILLKAKNLILRTKTCYNSPFFRFWEFFHSLEMDDIELGKQILNDIQHPWSRNDWFLVLDWLTEIVKRSAMNPSSIHENAPYFESLFDGIFMLVFEKQKKIICELLSSMSARSISKKQKTK